MSVVFLSAEAIARLVFPFSIQKAVAARGSPSFYRLFHRPMAIGWRFMSLDFRSVRFQFDSQLQPLVSNVTLRFGPGFTGIVGPNGCGKTTLLLLACGKLRPTEGRVNVSGTVVYCAQRTDDAPSNLSPLLDTPDHLAARLVGQFGLQPSWPARWTTLSHGERKRAQIACALWREPAVLAIDEPTNHIDAATRRLLITALRQYRGIGLLVSHDRELLDALCTSCVMFEHGSINHRPGNYAQAHADAERQMEDLRRRKENATRAAETLAATAHDRRREADRADARRSRRHIAPGDNDGRGRINLARLTGKDGQAGRLLRQLQGRLDQAADRADSLFVPKQPRLGIELLGEISRKSVLLRVEECRIAIAPERQLQIPRLSIGSEDRIGVTGPNGGGKSTLLRHLLAELSGGVRVLDLPQEIDAARSQDILQEVRRLDRKQLGSVMSGIASLGSEPAKLLATELPSPGELRKLLLAMGLSRRPHLIVMDEPTNHLDLPSIECLETALKDCRCALLLVSHDADLLERVTGTRWSITQTAEGSLLSIDHFHQETMIREP